MSTSTSHSGYSPTTSVMSSGENHAPRTATLFGRRPTLRALAERFVGGRLSDEALGRMTDARAREQQQVEVAPGAAARAIRCRTVRTGRDQRARARRKAMSLTSLTRPSCFATVVT